MLIVYFKLIYYLKNFFFDYFYVKTDFELAEAIELDYYRFEPYLRHALHELIAVDNQNYIYDIDRGQRLYIDYILN